MSNETKTKGGLRWLWRLVRLIPWPKQTQSDASFFRAPAPAYGRWVVCAALRLPSGRKICGPRHFDPTMRSQIANDTEAAAWKTAEQGFVDQRGEWLTREEALQIALYNGQRRKRCGGDSTRLYSENLY